MDFIERYLMKRIEDHSRELEILELKLSEYIGLRSEREIRREESFYRFMKSARLLAFEHWIPSLKRLVCRQPLTALDTPIAYARDRIITLREVLEAVLPGALSDWDFCCAVSTPCYAIDTSIYVSPPSSLKIWSEQWHVNRALCRYQPTLNLPQGMIVTYIRWGSETAYPRIYFRNQTSPGDCSFAYEYGLTMSVNGVALYRHENGQYVPVDSKSAYITVNTNTWYHRRVTWWIDSGILIVRVEQEVEGIWKKVCDDLIDLENKWATSNKNRVGVGNESKYGETVWYDDTEIWGP